MCQEVFSAIPKVSRKARAKQRVSTSFVAVSVPSTSKTSKFTLMPVLYVKLQPRIIAFLAPDKRSRGAASAAIDSSPEFIECPAPPEPHSLDPIFAGTLGECGPCRGPPARRNLLLIQK